MKTKLYVLIFLLAAAQAQAQTNNLTALLQQGLFEEQANRNLDAAIANYQSLAMQFDKDRQLAATAVFRLGECYRAQGKTNEAAAQYQRVLRDFSNEQTLATLSRQNLTGMGIAAPSTAVISSSAGLVQQKELLGEEIKVVEQQLASQQAQIKVGRLEADGVLPTQQKLLELSRQLAALDSYRVDLSNLNVPAASEEDQEIARIQQMIQNSPDLISARVDGGTPLSKAAANGWLKVATFLMDHGVDVNSSYALSAAVNAGNRAMVELLLSRGAKVGEIDNSYGRTLLQTAVQKGYQNVVEVLLANKADVNKPDNSGRTPLMAAATVGQVKIAKILLAAGAEVNVENEKGRTPLSCAIENGWQDLIRLLLAAKADPNGGKLDAPLLAAVYKKDVVSAELLLQAGANPKALGENDWDVPVTIDGGRYMGHKPVTPLFVAVFNHQLPMVQLLLKFKADPNDSLTEGKPLLFSALSDTNILEALLDAGAKVDARDATSKTGDNRLLNWTPLLWALVNNFPDVEAEVEILLKHGANPNAKDSAFDQTPLHWMLGWGSERVPRPKVVELLLDHGANPNVRNEAGRTPLDMIKDIIRRYHNGLPSGRGLPGGNNISSEDIKPAGELADLLRQHGALDNLPNWDRIAASRPGKDFSTDIFRKGTNDWNHYTLLELVSRTYHYNSWDGLLFFDLSRVVIARPGTNGAAKRMEINLLNGTNSIDFTKDVPLEFGDVVEIPERSHTLAEKDNWFDGGLGQKLIEHLREQAGEIRLAVGGQTVQLPLKDFAPDYGYIREVLQRSAQNILTSSSDLSRVKVTRRDPKTQKLIEWILDCRPSNPPDSPDLLLRDGDVVEVPQKQ